jgi:hypothetical protein
MPPLPRFHSIQAVAVASLVFLGVGSIGSRTVVAQVDDAAVAADSDLELLERAESGAYQTYSIKFSTRANNSVLTTRKDGVAAEVRIDSTECLALWRALVKLSLETLDDAKPEQAFPDQSHFTVKYRVGQTTGGFAAYGVDSLADERYRKVVGAILDVADKYAR